MLGYIQGLLARFFNYIYGFWSPSESEETTPLDPREPIVDEDYMHYRDMKELNDIFGYVREKRKSIKRKCRETQKLHPL